MIVRATVARAHELGMTVVAEGVETSQEHAAVVALGCDEAQGRYFARPASALEIEQRLA